MIRPGSCDPGCRPSDPAAFFADRHEAGMRPKKPFRGERSGERLNFRKPTERGVAEIRRFLHERGFFRFGVIDGLCGCRTASSMRRFPEHVRSVEVDVSIGSPDGIFGRKRLVHLRRWQAQGLNAEGNRFSSHGPQTDYRRWFALLAAVKNLYLAQPTGLLRRVAETGRRMRRRRGGRPKTLGPGEPATAGATQ